MKVIQPVLKVTGLIAIVLLALLVYTFVASEAGRGGNQTPAPPATRGKPDPAQLPEVTLAIIKAGKMSARSASLPKFEE